MDKEITTIETKTKAVSEVKKQKINKIFCCVNYYKPSRNVTSVSYEVDGTAYSAFINGKYSGNITIEYRGDIFCNENIVKVKE